MSSHILFELPGKRCLLCACKMRKTKNDGPKYTLTFFPSGRPRLASIQIQMNNGRVDQRKTFIRTRLTVLARNPADFAT